MPTLMIKIKFPGSYSDEHGLRATSLRILHVRKWLLRRYVNRDVYIVPLPRSSARELFFGVEKEDKEKE